MRKVEKKDLIRRSSRLWEVPDDFIPGMQVPAQVVAGEALLDAILADRSLNQLVNVATLPGIVKAALVMPDVHEGYGFPIGGVAATRHPHGVISPGGIGYDINCGVRLLVSRLPYSEVADQMEALAVELKRLVPSGLGESGPVDLSIHEVNRVLAEGSEWALSQGYADAEELEHTESYGRLPEADPEKVSHKAKQRGHDQLGTIGSGNHFVEVGRVEHLFDAAAARAFGLWEDQLVVLIHTGSRGLGHQVATDYIRRMQTAMPEYGYTPPDRELACVPFDSPEGRDYFGAMCAAANFAWCNRQLVAWEVRRAWENVFGESGGGLRLLYDVAHNIAKVEEHRLNGERTKVIVHRKGATRAFGPGFEELPAAFRAHGQPVLIPGSMGTCSYVLVGSTRSMDLTFGSSCHGAGRRLSRRAAKKAVDAPKLQEELRRQGIYVEAGSYQGLAEEAPMAYKDVNLVVDTVDALDVARKVARLKPLAVVKG